MQGDFTRFENGFTGIVGTEALRVRLLLGSIDDYDLNKPLKNFTELNSVMAN